MDYFQLKCLFFFNVKHRYIRRTYKRYHVILSRINVTCQYISF